MWLFFYSLFFFFSYFIIHPILHEFNDPAVYIPFVHSCVCIYSWFRFLMPSLSCLIILLLGLRLLYRVMTMGVRWMIVDNYIWYIRRGLAEGSPKFRDPETIKLPSFNAWPHPPALFMLHHSGIECTRSPCCSVGTRSDASHDIEMEICEKQLACFSNCNIKVGACSWCNRDCYAMESIAFGIMNTFD